LLRHHSRGDVDISSPHLFFRSNGNDSVERSSASRSLRDFRPLLPTHSVIVIETSDHAGRGPAASRKVCGSSASHDESADYQKVRCARRSPRPRKRSRLQDLFRESGSFENSCLSAALQGPRQYLAVRALAPLCHHPFPFRRCRLWLCCWPPRGCLPHRTP
jgi:hypothetical protein